MLLWVLFVYGVRYFINASSSTEYITPEASILPWSWTSSRHPA